MQRTLNFTVSGQHIKSTNSIEDIVANTSGYLKAKFELDSLYNGLMVAAVFTAEGKNYALVLGEEKEVVIPREVLRGESFRVGIYGAAGERIITTDTVEIPLSESVRVRFSQNKSYLELYTQLKEEIKIFLEKTETMLANHINLSVQQASGVHELRIIEGLLQYYNHDLKAWVDIKTGELSGIIANNLITSESGKVLDASQGFLLYQKLQEYAEKHKVTKGIFEYFYNGTMIPVAKQESLDEANEKIDKLNNHTKFEIYEECTIGNGGTQRLYKGAAGRFMLVSATGGNIGKAYNIYLLTDSAGSVQEINKVFSTLTINKIPANGFDVTNTADSIKQIRICNMICFDGM